MLRKLPELTPDNAAFWQGGRDGALNIHWCAACAQYFHPPSPVCPRCRSTDVAPRAVSGNGAVATFTINHQRWTPDLETPYVVAIVELAEQPGLRFLTNIVGCPIDQIAIDMPVRVRFEQHDDIWLPLFERRT